MSAIRQFLITELVNNFLYRIIHTTEWHLIQSKTIKGKSYRAVVQ